MIEKEVSSIAKFDSIWQYLFAGGFNMFFFNDLDNKIEKNEKSIKALTLQIEDVEKQINEFLNAININVDLVSSFVEDKENFSEENWSTLIEHKKALEEKLERDLANLKNPSKTKKAMKSLRVKNHWLYVK